MVSFHKWMVGLALAVIMISALGVNAMLFSARSFQFNLAQIAPSTNGLISVDALMDADKQIQDIERESAQTRGAQIQVEQQLAQVTSETDALQNQINATRADIAGDVATVEQHAGAASAQPAAMLDADALQGRIQSLAQQPRLAPADQHTVATLRGQVDQLSSLEDRLSQSDQQKATLTAQQRLVGGQVAEADRRILALKQAAVGNYDQYDRIRSEVVSLMRTSPLGVGATLVQLHPTFMSTVLVLLMGALGAILYLFPAYMSRANPVTFAEIMVRLIFGMCTALAFYIVANATLAGFSFVPGQQATGSAAMLNPFTVSLIGIIAGVMADDIARWIKNRGSELFGGQAPAPSATTAAATTSNIDPGFTGVNPHGGPPDV